MTVLRFLAAGILTVLATPFVLLWLLWQLFVVVFDAITNDPTLPKD